MHGKVDKSKVLYMIADANLPLKYVSSGHLLSRNEFIHPERKLDTYVFIVVLEGTLHIEQQNRRYSVGPNQFIILYADMLHRGYEPSGGLLSYHWVHFSLAPSLPRYVEATSAAHCQKINGFDPDQTYLMPEYGTLDITSQVMLLFSQLLNTAKRKAKPAPIFDYALSQMVLQLSRLLLINPGIDNYPLHVAKVIDWVTNNYQSPLTVQNIAEHFHYHPNYLSTDMKRYTGMTLSAYVNHVRIDVAKSLLANYDLHVSDIAHQCGYQDEKYFMRVFRRSVGITPIEYRRTFALRRQID